MENLQGHARVTLGKYNEVVIELKRAIQFTEEKDFDARNRMVRRIESLLSELEDTTLGTRLVRQMYHNYTFPFREVYSLLEKIKTDEINFSEARSHLNEISKYVPSLARESMV